MLPFDSFSVAQLPKIIFGAGTLMQAPEEAARFGRRLLLVTGERAVQGGAGWERFLRGLEARGLAWLQLTVAGEPSPELVDEAVARFRDEQIDCVLAVGGGSVLDAAKAVAGLLRPGNSVMDHLEGVGPELPYEGPALPFIACPTTAGTGSEATKNAVLSRHGRDGFKKSFRDDQLIARVAIVDPELLATCPPSLLAANGMDAFTQLLESFVSTRANPFTEALAWSGMEAFRDGFFATWEGGRGADAGRSRIAYASLLSGICLAQTGLGSVHGMASPLGALFPIPHGVVCGTLLAEATQMNIHALRARMPESLALEKYARVGAMLNRRPFTTCEEGGDLLVATLRDWVSYLGLPTLGHFGVGGDDLAGVAAQSRGSSMKTNPLELEDGELIEVMRRRL